MGVISRNYKKLLSDIFPLSPATVCWELAQGLDILLHQTRHDEIHIIGCHALFDFVNNQRDGTCMFKFEGLIPKLCLLAQGMGDDERAQHLRSAGLQALSSTIWFMGEFSHMSAEFERVYNHNYYDETPAEKHTLLA